MQILIEYTVHVDDNTCTQYRKNQRVVCSDELYENNNFDNFDLYSMANANLDI